MSSPSRPESGTPGLQFDRAIPADGENAAAAPAMTCPRCQREIRTHYYHVDGAPVCPACKQTVEQEMARRNSPATMARAALFGFGASVVGAIVYYGVMALLDLEIGIVAILTGYLVGRAMRKGTNGVGGRRYQIMAVALTYLSISMAYLPFAFKGFLEGSAKKPAVTAPAAARSDSVAAASDSATSSDSADAAATTADSAAAAAPAPVKPAAPTKPKAVGAGTFALGVVVLIGLALALPILGIVGSLPTGLISAFIIFIGMRQAWRMTAEEAQRITGPYKVGAAPAQG